MNKKSKIGIIGSKNAIGIALLKNLKKQGYKNISVLDFNINKENLNKKIQNYFNRNKPNYIFVLIGDYGGILKNRLYPADLMIDNLIASSLVLNTAIKPYVKKLIYFSSSCIYPHKIKQPLNVDKILSNYLEPTNLHYALSKISAMYLCDAINIQHKKNFITVIPSNFFGPYDNFDEKNSHLISSLISKIYYAKKNNHKNIKLWGSGKPIRDFTHIEDIAASSILIMRKNIKNKIINISSGNNYSVKKVAELVKKIIGFEGKIIFDKSMPDGMKIKTLDNKEIKKIGYKFTRNFEKDLLETFEWFKKYIL